MTKFFFPRYIIRLGENDATSNVDCDGKICAPEPQDFYLDTIFIHRQYNERTNINDIALLKLTHDAALNGKTFSEFHLA